MAFPDMGVHAVVQGYDKYVQQMGGMASKTQQTYGVLGSLRSISLTNLVVGAGKAVFAIGAIGTAAAAAGVAVGAMLFKAAEGAAPLYDIQEAFRGITAAAGTTGEAVISTWKEASRGTISAIDLMRNYNLATQLLGTTLSEELPSVLPSIAKVAAATGQSVGQLTNDFIRGIGRESIMILDNLGIVVDLEQIMGDYAKTLGTTGDKLTKSQRQTALLAAASAALAKNTEAIPDAALTAAGAFLQLRATIKDTKDEILMGLVPAMLPLVKQMGILAKQYMPLLSALIFRSVLPAIASLATWLSLRLGPAIATLIAIWGMLGAAVSRGAAYWSDSLLPALDSVAKRISGFLLPLLGRFSDYWTDTLVPALRTAYSWLQVSLPGAFATAKGSISGTYDVLVILWGFLNDKVIPAFMTVYDWLATKVKPIFDAVAPSIATLAPLFLPLIGVLGSLATGNIPALIFSLIGLLIPAIGLLMPWLEVNLPAAFQTLMGYWDQLTAGVSEGASFWTSTLQPALLTVWDTLMKQLAPAFETIALVWTDTVMPALRLVWKWFVELMLPALITVGDVIGSVLNFALRVLWAFIVNKVIPVVSELWGWISEKLGPVFEWLSTLITAVKDVLDPLWVVMHEFADTVRGLEIPDWLQGHSPSPFEKTLAGIRGQLLEINRIGGPLLGGGRLSPLAVSAGGDGGGGGGDTFSPAYNLSIHTAARQEQVAADFGMMQALSRRR